MRTAQHKGPGTVLIHPTACSSLQKILAFQRRTGMQLVITEAGTVQAVPSPCAGGAA